MKNVWVLLFVLMVGCSVDNETNLGRGEKSFMTMFSKNCVFVSPRYFCDAFFPCDDFIMRDKSWEYVVEEGQIDFSVLNDVRDMLKMQIYGCRDIDAYGVSDYWQTTGETIKLCKGDCEDFANLFKRRLSENNFPEKNMGVVVFEMVRGQESEYHAAVVIYENPDEDVFTMYNNYVLSPGTTIYPVYGFNTNTYWRYY